MIQANIVIIRSKSTEIEKLNVILPKINPYIYVIFIPKHLNSEHYLNNELKQTILDNIKGIYHKRSILLNLKNKNFIDNATIDKMDNYLNGITTYSGLNDSKIDELINSIKN